MAILKAIHLPSKTLVQDPATRQALEEIERWSSALPSALTATSVTAPLIVGGTDPTSTLTLESTSGVGTTDYIDFKVGSQVSRVRFVAPSPLGDTGVNYFAEEPANLGLDPQSLGAPSLVVDSVNTVSTVAHVFAGYAANAVGAAVAFIKTRAASLASHVAVVSGDGLGELHFQGDNGTNFQDGAAIKAFSDGTPSSTSMPGRLSLYSTPSGSNALNERQRIDNAGANYFISVGTTGSAANAFLNNASSPANSLLRSTSSKRYKTDIAPITPAEAAGVIAIPVVSYKSLAPADDPTRVFYGMTAEDVAAINPSLVHWGYQDSDYTDVAVTDGLGQHHVERSLNPGATLVPDAVQYDRVAILQIQALRAELADLKSQLAELRDHPKG